MPVHPARMPTAEDKKRRGRSHTVSGKVIFEGIRSARASCVYDGARAERADQVNRPPRLNTPRADMTTFTSTLATDSRNRFLNSLFISSLVVSLEAE